MIYGFITPSASPVGVHGLSPGSSIQKTIRGWLGGGRIYVGGRKLRCYGGDVPVSDFIFTPFRDRVVLFLWRLRGPHLPSPFQFYLDRSHTVKDVLFRGTSPKYFLSLRIPYICPEPSSDVPKPVSEHGRYGRRNF